MRFCCEAAIDISLSYPTSHRPASRTRSPPRGEFHVRVTRIEWWVWLWVCVQWSVGGSRTLYFSCRLAEGIGGEGVMRESG
jgi:hypothetical protein